MLQDAGGDVERAGLAGSPRVRVVASAERHATVDRSLRLLGQGWTDSLRTMHPDETIYTFWDYFRNAFVRDAGLRIDHVLLSPPLAGRLVAAEVDSHVRGWEKTSDHAPVWIALSNENVKKRSKS